MRRSAGTLRAITDNKTAQVVPAPATPMMMPVLTCSSQIVDALASMRRPRNWNNPATAMTRPEPNLSAMAPTNGCANPQAKFWIARDSEKTVIPMPKLCDMEDWNRPKL